MPAPLFYLPPVTPNHMHSSVLNDWVLSEQAIKNCDEYYILYWDKAHIFSVLTPDHTILHSGIEYLPIYKGAIFNEACTRIRLSFRKPKIETGIPAYVLIKPAAQKE